MSDAGSKRKAEAAEDVVSGDEYEYDDYFEREQREQQRLEEARAQRRKRLLQTPAEDPTPAFQPNASSRGGLTENHAKPEAHKSTSASAPAESVSVPADDSLSKASQPDTAGAVHQPPASALRRVDEIDDMFNMEDTPAEDDESGRVPDLAAIPLPSVDALASAPSASGLHDNWDDPDGYYRVILGEKLHQGRYQVFSILGRGMFASVVRAKDLAQNEQEVAIKIARRQETMYKAGMKEMRTLELLAKADPDDRMHVVRLYTSFEHRGHLCTVFESLGLNLRDIVKRFGKDVGLNLQAVKTYAKQMFLALALLRKENIIHADIKPDNILVNEAKTMAKLADLGSASSTTEMEITPYLVSRFYRAPEISTWYSRD